MVASTAAAGGRSLQQLVAPNTRWQHVQQLRCLTAAALATPRASAAAATEHTATSAALELTAVGPAPVAAYVHLPFCKRKCFYCDFPVEAVGLNVNKTSECSSWRVCHSRTLHAPTNAY